MCQNSGILCNNFLGEEDLNPNGFLGSFPAETIPSMMSPTLVYEIEASGEKTLKYIFGTPGSNRIVTVVSQFIDLLSLSYSC